MIEALPDEGKTARHSALISSQLREVLASQGREFAAAGLLPLLDIRAASTGSELIDKLTGKLPQALEKM